MTESALVTIIVVTVIVVMILGAGFYSYFGAIEAEKKERQRYEAHIAGHLEKGETATFHNGHNAIGQHFYYFLVCDLCGERFFEVYLPPPRYLIE